MLSAKGLTTAAFLAGGGATSGYLGWKRANQHQEFDTEDKLGYTTSLAIGGIGAGAALRYIGAGRTLGALGNIAGKSASLAKKVATNPTLRSTPLKLLTGKNIPFSKAPGAVKGVLGLLALTAVAGVAVASNRNPEPDEMMYASRDRAGQTQYNNQSMKERMGLLGASGDMVFGLNNLRHG